MLQKNSLLLLFLFLFSFSAKSSDKVDSGDGEFKPSELIIHHVLDDHIWHFFDGHYGTLYLPVIVYSGEKGLDVFSSSNFYDEDHKVVDYDGYRLVHGHISIIGSDSHVLDVSITKNVFFLILTATLLMVSLIGVAKSYKKNPTSAPSGFQNFLELLIVYLRDEVIKPNIGEGKYQKFMPYLLTLFFFILFGNILGLLPGAANLTGNIAVTLVLALFTFLYTNLNGKSTYWKHIFLPPVPKWLYVVIVPIEILGIFTKPISLLVRLFVAITAGHIVILSLISLVFIFGSAYVGIGSTIIVLFINIIEILVAFIQAYVFTMFSSLYIGMAVEENH
ncbi:MAG: F0F1 ATP synthase subunit A [Bacteroidota bacterium]